jgi:hypothetical protein
MIWTTQFWESTFLTIYHGNHLPQSYFETVSPFINQFASHSHFAWGFIAFSLMLIKIVMYKLGRGFLRKTNNLPISMSFQKNVCILMEVTASLFWFGLILYAAGVIFVGLLWYQQHQFILWVLHKFLYGWVAGTVLGVVAGIVAKRILWNCYEPYCSKWIDENKKSSKSMGLSDIRNVHDEMAESITFNPKDFFKQGQVFFGKDDKDLPIYMSWGKFNKAHTQIMGCTGSGKGVVAVSLLAQVMLNGGAVVVLEPKQGGDEWAPHVLKHMCTNLKKNFHYIDLQALTPQLNLLKNITADQLDQLLQAGMGIEDKGGDGDYYRLKDRKAARKGSYLAGRAENFPHFRHLMQQELSEHLEAADSFSDKLEMLCEIPAIQTSGGLDLEKALSDGDCIYIIGSPDRAQIKLLQRMVLLRIKQLIEHRDRLKKHRHATIFIDEVKYFLTRPVLDSLAMIRDHQCNIILAHQAPGDLYDVPKDLDGQACYACVTNNTNIKLIYKINDDRDRKMTSSLTGSKVVQRDSKEVMTNSGMGELIATDKKHTMDVQVPLYDENFFAALKERVGIMFGSGVAKLCFTSFITVEKEKIDVKAAEPCPNYESKKDDVSSLSKPNKPEIKAPNESSKANVDAKNTEEKMIQFYDEIIYEMEEGAYDDN